MRHTMTTRQHILDILSETGEATIEMIAEALKERSGKAVTSVTIRYHLNVLLDEGLVTEPRTVPRASRGRPQHVFAAAPVDKSRGNAAELLTHVLSALEHQSPEVAGSVIDQVITTMKGDAAISPSEPLAKRVSASAQFLNARGYKADFEQVEKGFILYTKHCPYHDIPQRTAAVCGLDMRLIEAVVGQPVQRLMRLADGDQSCAYFIEENC